MLKTNKILLSYTTMDDLYKSPHSWLNKQMGLKKPESDAMKAGSEAHKRLQAHISGKKIDGIELDLDFPRAEYHARKDWDDKYTLHGYCDGVNFGAKTFVEIKTGGKKTWTNGDFERSIQPAYYSYVTGFRKCFLVTCLFDLSNMKVFYREFTDKDWKRAQDWVKGATEIIDKGNFKSDLVEGKCIGWCNYGDNCYFR